MKRELVLRGVPRSIALDGWWLTPPPEPRGDRVDGTQEAETRSPDQAPRSSVGR
ncbi:hypothetical protein R3X27_00725 [Tropicimonas sp. TH_r6]|uniref:hypothetical protein n=1 Tax=Tropicimonas sp. TH_r6 TaxID=3082085 RepID=UPI002952C863|nr:hypothetical protein [Tropicimonas sp. TH_r6]MDV7141195.1 hypothetical protein [Tropicimonas sp. TH_r6]